MKPYFENRDLIIPFEKVMFLKYDIAGTIFIFFSSQYTSGGRVVEKIMLSDDDALKFVDDYKKWLESR